MTITDMINMSFDSIIAESNTFSKVKIIQHSKFTDHRGQLWTTFDENLNKGEFLNNLKFNHDKFAVSGKHVLRGVHGDNKSWKLVSVIHGCVFQVVVDCRIESETYLKYETYELFGNDPKSILIPPGFGNAFLSLSDNSVYHYKLAYTGEYHDADKQFTLKWNDKRINIPWPVKNPILSERDR